MNRIMLASVGLLSALFMGCGSDDTEEKEDKDTPTKAELNQSNAKSATKLAVDAAVQVTSGTSENMQSAAWSLNAAGAAGFMTLDWTAAVGATPQGGVGTSAQAVGETGTCTCDAAGCSFENCGDSSGMYVINGTMSWAGNTLNCDLDTTIAVSSGGTGLESTFHMECGLTVTDTSIDGTLSTTGATTVSGGAAGQTGSIAWSSSMTYNDVQFDATSHCATSGSVDIAASYSAVGIINVEGSGTITFDGTCS